MRYLFIITLSLFILNSKSIAQNTQVIDSLKQVLKTAKADTIKLKALFSLAGEYYLAKPDSAIFYISNALELAQKISDKKAIGEAYGWLGYLVNKTDPGKAIEYYKQSLEIRKELGDREGMATSLNNLAYTYRQMGNIPKALEYYSSSLKLYEKEKNEQGIAESYNNLSSLYIYIGDTIKAIELNKKSLELYAKNNNKYGIATTNLWLGFIAKNKGKYNEALEYFNISLAIQNEIKDVFGIASTYNNIGIIYQYLGEEARALDYFEKSLAIRESINDRQGISFTLVNIAHIQFKNNQTEKALQKGLRAYEISKELGFIDNIERSAGLLKKIYKKQGDYKKAFQYFEEERAMHDSVMNKDNFKKAQKQQAKYEYDKKSAVDSIAHSKEIKIKNLEITKEKAIAERQRIIIGLVIVGLVFVLGFLFVLFRMFIQKKRANHLLSERNIEIMAQKEEISSQRDEIISQRDVVVRQKDHIEHIHTKLTDSINYAKRIQTAVLPDLELLLEDRTLPVSDYFVLYRPKDIVSGDFYWATNSGGYLIFTVADCTGHGVPGAFMSMLGVSFLNEIVRKKEIYRANQILENLRSSVIEALQQKGQSGEQQDGMDIALAVLNTKTLELQYSGAYNPLIVISEEQGLVISNPDKQPVAIHAKQTPFTNNLIQLHKGDCIYLMSDGYEDQFGGPQNKKFKFAQVKELLLSVYQRPMNEQQKILETTFVKWKGENDQIDDVTIMGIRL
jgi:serine phosphatase RsbU (regulator of sigma subunit)/tetratricopeptide (TPR) repeat protein